MSTPPKPENMSTLPKPGVIIQVSDEDIASIEAATHDKKTKEGGLR